MKKFEGILTLFGVALIIGLPMFLMFGSLRNDSQVFCENYINILSYDENVGTAYSDFEQSYPALDGSQSRDEIVYLYNDTDTNTINESIVTFNETIPLGITYDEEETVTQTVVSEKPSYIYIEPVLVVDIPDDDVTEDDINNESEDDFDISDTIYIDITNELPLALAASSDYVATEEEFGEENLVLSEDFFEEDTESLNVIEISDDIPQAIIQDIDSAAGSIIAETYCIPEEEIFSDEKAKIANNETILINEEEDLIPEGIILEAEPEEFGDIDSSEVIILEEDVPEGINDKESTEVRTVVSVTDENGNAYDVFTDFLY